MKLTWILITCTAFMLCTACNFKEPHTYGNKIDTANAVPVNEAWVKNGINKVCTIKGRITEVCQNEGCWLNAEGSNGQKVMLSFEHKFTVPKDISGKNVMAQGVFYNDTTSVDALKKQAYEEDPKAVTDSIKSPKVEVKFNPNGVVVY